ncbi:MAG TPA: peroxiredoxin-like family protein [Acidimicrobiales bacterium]|jgi:peroxiredoxin
MNESKTMTNELDAIKEEGKLRLPADVVTTFVADQDELDAAGVPATVSKIGTTVPDVTLLSITGAPVTLREVRGGRPAVVVFYRGAWCPYCNLTLRSYQSALEPELNRLGTSLIAVSPQKPDGSLSMKEKNELSFPVLSDPANTLARALGIVARPTPGTRAAQLKLGLDISTLNIDEETDLPMPTVIILDGEGTIRWIDVHPNYTTRSEPQDILDAYKATLRGE